MHPQAAAPPAPADAKPRPRVLVADDETPVLAFLEIKLAKAGFDVVTVRDGDEALRRLIEQPFDLVLTDYHMPNTDGVELCRRLLVHPTTRHIPVIVMTSPWCKVGDELRQLPNVVELLEKPLDLAELVVKARQWAAPRGPSPAAERPA